MLIHHFNCFAPRAFPPHTVDLLRLHQNGAGPLHTIFFAFWVRLLAHSDYPIAHLSSLLESDVTSSSDVATETEELEPWRDMRDRRLNSTKYTAGSSKPIIVST